MMDFTLRRSLKKRVGIGRFGLPLWVICLSALGIMAAAGQAVGPVLAGSVQGSVGVAAEQAVVLGGSSSIDGAHDNGLVVESDEGTGFTAALEMHVGDTGQKVSLDVTNAGDDDANAVLELNVPAGIDVEVDSAGAGLKEAQLGASAWLLEVSPGNADRLEITVEPENDTRPGFHTITGRIVQIGG